jgi:hypothetical protein
MRTKKPDVDEFIRGAASSPVIVAETSAPEATKPVKKVVKPRLQKKPATQPAPKKKEAVKDIKKTEYIISKKVKLLLEMSENLRKAVKRHVIDLDGITMNTYMVEAIRKQLKADGADI